MAIYSATANISCPHSRCPVTVTETAYSAESQADAQSKADTAAKNKFDSSNHQNHDG